jgi:hypothetical protein
VARTAASAADSDSDLDPDNAHGSGAGGGRRGGRNPNARGARLDADSGGHADSQYANVRSAEGNAHSARSNARASNRDAGATSASHLYAGSSRAHEAARQTGDSNRTANRGSTKPALSAHTAARLRRTSSSPHRSVPNPLARRHIRFAVNATRSA